MNQRKGQNVITARSYPVPRLPLKNLTIRRFDPPLLRLPHIGDSAAFDHSP
jgi:hypothetical protein